MDVQKQLQFSMGLNGLIAIVLSIICIAISWRALQQFRFDLFLKQPGSPLSKLLQIIVSIVLGYETARFILDYFQWSTALKGMF